MAWVLASTPGVPLHNEPRSFFVTRVNGHHDTGISEFYDHFDHYHSDPKCALFASLRQDAYNSALLFTGVKSLSGRCVLWRIRPPCVFVVCIAIHFT